MGRQVLEKGENANSEITSESSQNPYKWGLFEGGVQCNLPMNFFRNYVKDLEQLLSIKTGKDYIISRITTTPETAQRLRELGFNENTVIRTIVNRSSQLICEVNNTRIGLHHRTAKDILVSAVK